MEKGGEKARVCHRGGGSRRFREMQGFLLRDGGYKRRGQRRGCIFRGRGGGKWDPTGRVTGRDAWGKAEGPHYFVKRRGWVAVSRGRVGRGRKGWSGSFLGDCWPRGLNINTKKRGGRGVAQNQTKKKGRKKTRKNQKPTKPNPQNKTTRKKRKKKKEKKRKKKQTEKKKKLCIKPSEGRHVRARNNKGYEIYKIRVPFEGGEENSERRRFWFLMRPLMTKSKEKRIPKAKPILYLTTEEIYQKKRPRSHLIAGGRGRLAGESVAKGAQLPSKIKRKNTKRTRKTEKGSYPTDRKKRAIN